MVLWRHPHFEHQDFLLLTNIQISGESLGTSEGLDQNVKRNTNKKIRAGILLFKAVLITNQRGCLSIFK